MTRKLGATPNVAVDLVRELRRFEVVVLTPDLIEDAMRFHATKQTSFWDALIVSAAAFANCAVLYSEDMSHGRFVMGVKITNPFAVL